MLTAAHQLEMEFARNTVLLCQADEFVIGKRKYNRGARTNANGQMWFQSLVSICPSTKRVLAFYVRYVPNRTANVLQRWIIDLCANGAQVSTDSFSSYYSLESTALESGKVISARMVNHSVEFTTADGIHTNAVEGMHKHVRAFLRTLGRLSSKKHERVFQVLAAAQMCNPAYNPGNPCRFQRFMLSVKRVAASGAPPTRIANTSFKSQDAKEKEKKDAMDFNTLCVIGDKVFKWSLSGIVGDEVDISPVTPQKALAMLDKDAAAAAEAAKKKNDKTPSAIAKENSRREKKTARIKKQPPHLPSTPYVSHRHDPEPPERSLVTLTRLCYIFSIKCVMVFV